MTTEHERWKEGHQISVSQEWAKKINSCTLLVCQQYRLFVLLFFSSQSIIWAVLRPAAQECLCQDNNESYVLEHPNMNYERVNAVNQLVIYPDFPLNSTGFFKVKHVIQFLGNKIQSFWNFVLDNCIVILMLKFLNRLSMKLSPSRFILTVL